MLLCLTWVLFCTAFIRDSSSIPFESISICDLNGPPFLSLKNLMRYGPNTVGDHLRMNALKGVTLGSAIKKAQDIPTVRVRLAQGNTEKDGRVEVLYNGEWGTICDDQFTEREAGVICHMLGYTRDASVRTPQHYQAGTGKIWLDDVKCDGDESTVAKCMHTGWGAAQESCDHTEDVGIVCLGSRIGIGRGTTKRATGGSTGVLRTPSPSTSCPERVTKVRLVPFSQSAPSAGRVELLHEGRWGTICDDLWNANSAKVICNMLCLPTAHVRAFTSATPGTGPIWMDNVQCVGDEQDISLCHRTDWSVNDCSHREDAAVSCESRIGRSFSGYPQMSYKCDRDNFEVTISRSWQRIISKRDITLLNATGKCSMRKDENATHISLTFPLTECNTKKAMNASYVSYLNTVVKSARPAQVDTIIQEPNFTLPIMCIKPRTRAIVNRYIPEITEFNAPLNPVIGAFPVDFVLCNNTVGVGTPLCGRINLQTKDSLKLVVLNLYASPQQSPTASNGYYSLINNRCTKDNTIASSYTNDTSFDFSFRAFKFFPETSPQVWLHSDLLVCQRLDKKLSCDRSCSVTSNPNRRKKRHVFKSLHLTQGPIYIVPLEGKQIQPIANSGLKLTSVWDIAMLTMVGCWIKFQ